MQRLVKIVDEIEALPVGTPKHTQSLRSLVSALGLPGLDTAEPEVLHAALAPAIEVIKRKRHTKWTPPKSMRSVWPHPLRPPSPT